MKDKVIIIVFAIFLASCSRPGGGQTSQSGSMAKMLIKDDRLYYNAVEGTDREALQVVQSFDISNPRKKIEKIDRVEIPYMPFNSEELNGAYESIFIKDDLLFLGTDMGFMIVDISNKSNMEFISWNEHLRARDPIVVNGHTAYVTLRSVGGGTWQDRLEVYDVSNINNPQLLGNMPLWNPHGLAVNGNNLFIADGRKGLKIFKQDTILNDREPIHTIDRIMAYDLIYNDNTLLVSAKEGLFQYQFDGNSEPEFISKIPIKEKAYDSRELLSKQSGSFWKYKMSDFKNVIGSIGMVVLAIIAVVLTIAVVVSAISAIGAFLFLTVKSIIGFVVKKKGP